LIVEDMGEEVLVYDLESNSGHSLSSTAARVWRCCDGETSVDDFVSQLDLDSDSVGHALDGLSGANLLEPLPQLDANGHTRREVTVRFAKVGAAVAAMPMIVSVAAPTPAMAVTLAFCRSACGGGPTGCTTDGCGDCCREEFEGCCCCDPGNGFVKDCVPADCGDATCIALHPEPNAHCSCGAVHC
jgi:hypothetical protein